jgi:hypothetical protein
MMGTGGAVLALRSAIPGRKLDRSQLLLISAGRADRNWPHCVGAVDCPCFKSSINTCRDPLDNFHKYRRRGPVDRLILGVRRGTPLAPRPASELIGVGAFSFAFVLGRLC